MSAYSAPRTLFHRLWFEPPPAVGIEFCSEAVGVARWEPGQGMIDQLTTEPLPEGALRASPVRENFQRFDDVRRAVAAALGRLGRKPGGNVAVFLPDVSARVTVLDFDSLPEKMDDALPLIRWRLKKAVPFEIDDASVAFQRQRHRAPSDGAQEVVVAAAPSAVVRQYEAIVESLGYRPRFVTVSSLAALGLLEQTDHPHSGTMLLRASGRLLTVVVTSGGALRMFRATELPGEEVHSVEEVVSDAYGSGVYFEDNFGGRIERIHLAGFGRRTSEICDAAERELGMRPQPLIVPGARAEEAVFLGIHGMVVEQARD